ncbi:MAG: hypothetical protein HQL40_13670 [Alphaproteobacteria bacterium]|nr:hypothetical protein [Alphaproteobacteria bacterium]MBF0334672.1 hypothetical protein [Alphaproteobacteria bacterium]
MNTTSTFPDVDHAALRALIAALPDGRSTTLDPADPVHRAGIEAALDAADRTAARYPALRKALSRPAANDSDALLTLVDLKRGGDGLIQATTWYAVSSQAVFSGGVSFLLDADSGAPLALAHQSDVSSGFVPLPLRATSADPADGRTSLLSLAYTASREGNVTCTALATVQGGPSVQEVTVVVDDPISAVHPAVMIAVGRDPSKPSPDADYSYAEPSGDELNPYLIVPFRGKAAQAWPVTGGVPGQPIPGARYESYLYSTASGSTTRIPLNSTYTGQQKLNAGVTLSATSPTTIVWDFPYDGKDYKTTASLVYDQNSMVNQRITFFQFTFSIPVDSPTSPLVFSVCSTGTPNQPVDRNTNCIQTIEFTWHCLAADTAVDLADGGTAPIATLNNGFRVRTGAADGASLAVEATTRGWHRAASDETGPGAVYQLVTESGSRLVGTGMHGIMTPDGLRPLCLLRPGDLVTTPTGTARVTQCEAVEWSGEFFNLKLGDESDRAAGLAADAVCTFVANGVVVGDIRATTAESMRLAHDVGHMLTRIDPSLATDFASAVADIRT